MLALLALALAACGRPSLPQPPQPDQFPKQYPGAPALPPGEQVPNIPIPAGPDWEGERGY
jgi:hypothetical protein